jgi:hypothetical protein
MGAGEGLLYLAGLRMSRQIPVTVSAPRMTLSGPDASGTPGRSTPTSRSDHRRDRGLSSSNRDAGTTRARSSHMPSGSQTARPHPVARFPSLKTSWRAPINP